MVIISVCSRREKKKNVIWIESQLLSLLEDGNENIGIGQYPPLTGKLFLTIPLELMTWMAKGLKPICITNRLVLYET